MTISQLITILNETEEWKDKEAVIESHCGSLNDIAGILPQDEMVIICNDEGYAQNSEGFRKLGEGKILNGK